MNYYDNLEEEPCIFCGGLHKGPCPCCQSCGKEHPHGQPCRCSACKQVHLPEDGCPGFNESPNQKIQKRAYKQKKFSFSENDKKFLKELNIKA